MSANNGPSYYGGPTAGPGGSAGNSMASGFAGTMGDGQVFPNHSTQRPQFGQQPPVQQVPFGAGSLSQQQPPPPGTPQPQALAGNPYTGQPAPSSSPYPTPQPPAQPAGTPSGYPAGSGSISRFASQLQQQQQQQVQASPGGAPLYPQSSPYNFQPPPGPGGGTAAASTAAPSNPGASTAGMSFAERSALLQQQQQNQQHQPPSRTAVAGNMYGSNTQSPMPQMTPQQQPQQAQAQVNTAGMSFAQRSAMMRQNQPPAQSNVYGGTPTQKQQQQPMMYGSPVPQQQQPQQQPPPSIYQRQPSTPQEQQRMGQAFGASSMMGSSMVPPQQQQQMQQQQPQLQSHQNYAGTMVPPQSQPTSLPPPSTGSYAQRAAMMAGQPPAPPPQQQQQPPSQMGMPPKTQPGMPPQQPGMMPPQQPGMMPPPAGGIFPPPQGPPKPNIYVDPPEVIAQQNRLLTDATRKVQEHAYYMKQAMEKNDLPTVLDRAASMVGELGEHAHSHHHHRAHPPAPGATGSTTALSPKNYYELHLRALEELPVLEDYLLNLSKGGGAPGAAPMMTPNPAPGLMPPNQQPPMAPPPSSSYSMKELYDYVQYCPNVLSRLYLQICAASALIRSGEVGAKWILKDMIEAVKCVQNPVRGLFLRHYLLQAFRDKLPNEPISATEVVPYGMVAPSAAAASTPGVTIPSTPAPTLTADVTNVEAGTVKDSYEFVLANFVQMNKLWVRIQHLPGDGKSKEIRRRREKDRNELRILVGTNLVRLSALDSITSQIYGQVILPTVLDHIVISGDPLAQAYLIDCIVQVFPDEYHIETMPILLAVCPKLRDKVNIRTILQSLMDRLANYLADEELLDEQDSNQVKRAMAQDSFRMIDECVQSVYNARGPKLQAKEVIRLQTALLSFSMKCYQGNLEQMTLCLDNCVVALQQARANQALMQDRNAPPQNPNAPRVLPQLDEVATKELEKLLSIPLEELALGVLTLDHYSDLIGFLPWTNRRHVALTMLDAVSKAGQSPKSLKEIDELFSVIAPVLRDEHDRGPNGPMGGASSMDRTANLMAGLGVSPQPQHRQHHPSGPQFRQDAALVSKLIHLLYHSDTDVHFEMLSLARNHLNAGKLERTGTAYVAIVVAGLKLAKRILMEQVGDVAETAEKASTKEANEEEKGKGATDIEGEESKSEEESQAEEEPKSKEDDSSPEETKSEAVEEDGEGNAMDEEETPVKEQSSEEKTESKSESKVPKAISCRKVFVFVQQTIAVLANGKPETGMKLFLEAAVTADKLSSKAEGKTTDQDCFGSIAHELIAQAFAVYEELAGDSTLQSRCIVAMVGTLLTCRSLSKADYEGLIMKAAQYSAKMSRKPEQCAMVAQCSHLFYVVGEGDAAIYSNPQRSLECLQRSLKLADACTNTNPANVQLFVDLLDHYLFFFEKKHPLIAGNYITGLAALIKEHSENLSKGAGAGSSAVSEARAHFLRIVKHIKMKKGEAETAEHFAEIDVSSIIT